VFFRLPLKPRLPELDHATVFPSESVRVTMTLLNVARTYAAPSGETPTFFRRPRVEGFLVDCCFAIWFCVYVYADMRPYEGIHYFFGAAFLPATVRLRPLRVRALVLVRCPLTGRPRRCRSPR